MTIDLPNHRDLTLLPEHALLLGETLILADTHFGKSASFRARGIPIPEGDTEQDTARILDLIECHQPSRFVIAGDFLHASESKSPAVLNTLSRFFSQLTCETHLVLGNHDVRAGQLPETWPVRIHETLEVDDFLIIHDPAHLSSVASAKGKAPTDQFSICGHLHPVARIKDGKKTALRAPCFWLRENQLVLPSFGTFTGGAVVHPEEGDRIFTPLNNRVVEIPREAL